jgi:hypothetical protein
MVDKGRGRNSLAGSVLQLDGRDLLSRRNKDGGEKKKNDY